MDMQFSIGHIILLTYIIIASNYCTNLFSKGLKEAIENNRMLQHLILLILIMSLIIISGNSNTVQVTKNEQFNIVIMSLLIYVWFILTTKLNIAWNIGIIILLAIYFLYESKQKSDNNQTLNDKLVPENVKLELYKTYVEQQQYVMMTIFGITLIGTFLYSNEQSVQYGGGFSYSKFFFS